MDSGYYAAYSGLLARTEALDSAASNLSNANTTGFRAEREYFRSAISGPHALDSQINRTVNDFGVIGGNHISTAQGALTKTGNTLDVAIEGEGFFQIQTPAGAQFTRDGAFKRLSNGTLATSSDEPVMTVQGKALVIPTGDTSIGSDGVVSVGGAVAGQIGVFNFKNASLLIPQGTNRYKSELETKPVPSQATVHQGALESSNQDIIQGSLQMILVQRQAEMMQKALSIFHTEFDKTASEELPRV